MQFQLFEPKTNKLISSFFCVVKVIQQIDFAGYGYLQGICGSYSMGLYICVCVYVYVCIFVCVYFYVCVYAHLVTTIE